MSTKSVNPTRALEGALLLATLAALCGPSADALGADTRGYLYGSVATRSGTTYEGRLRWGKEEAFWTDHFNASKDERPLVKDIPARYRRGHERIRIFGMNIGMRWPGQESRQLVVRFGDLKSILVDHGDDATIVLKNGEEMRIGGGSNDVGARITVWDKALGQIQVPWDKIRRIDFKPTPPDLAGVPIRLYGTVKTAAGTLKGFVQWDKEECLGTDTLDGETDDGKLALEMGKIKSIERRGRRASSVVTKDGRELVLSGTNDVNSDNRGIFVDDTRYGRVLVDWRTFDRVDFEEAGSGPAYEDFPPLGPLKGNVTTKDGASHKGRIVFDVDESEGWETLDGESDGLTYSIPFYMVGSVAPIGGARSKVTLRDGKEELRLGESADVSDGNAGVFVLDGDKKTYVPWEDVRRIDFDK